MEAGTGGERDSRAGIEGRGLRPLHSPARNAPRQGRARCILPGERSAPFPTRGGLPTCVPRRPDSQSSPWPCWSSSCASPEKLTRQSEEALSGGHVQQAYDKARKALDKEPGNERARQAMSAAAAQLMNGWKDSILTLAVSDTMAAARRCRSWTPSAATSATTTWGCRRTPPPRPGAADPLQRRGRVLPPGPAGAQGPPGPRGLRRVPGGARHPPRVPRRGIPRPRGLQPGRGARGHPAVRQPDRRARHVHRPGRTTTCTPRWCGGSRRTTSASPW